MNAEFDFSQRLDRARTLMEEQGIDALLLSVGADLPYLTGYEAMPLERLTMAVIAADEDATLVVPELEVPRVVARPDVVSIRGWAETEDPLDAVADLVGPRSVLAVGDQTWALFLLGLEERLPHASFRSVTPVTRPLRMRKESGEIEWLARAGAAADRVIGRLHSLRFSGRSELSLASEIATMLVEEGHETADVVIVASGPNAASPHHEPGPRIMKSGDSVVVDFGGRLGGYCSDTSRTFHIGEPDRAFVAAFDVVYRAQDEAVAAAGPGATAESIDAVARAVIDDAGLGDYFIHRTGHGIGLEIHEHPYLVGGNPTVLEPGMAFSVEPGVYIPGRFGIRIEDIVAIVDDGPRRLNESDRRLAIVS